MADQIGIEVVGDRKVALRFEKFPETLRAKFAGPIKSITSRLADMIRARTPKGEKGELPSLVYEQFFDDPDQVSGRVTFGDDYAKVGALEYGAPGPRNRNRVAEHPMELSHVFGSRLNRPLTVMVKAHRRQLNVKAHRMLRDPLAQMSAPALTELEAVVTAEASRDE
jgi:hypothetical protein